MKEKNKRKIFKTHLTHNNHLSVPINMQDKQSGRRTDGRTDIYMDVRFVPCAVAGINIKKSVSSTLLQSLTISSQQQTTTTAAAVNYKLTLFFRAIFTYFFI